VGLAVIYTGHCLDVTAKPPVVCYPLSFLHAHTLMTKALPLYEARGNTCPAKQHHIPDDLNLQYISNKLSRCATRKIRIRHIYNKSWPHPSKSLHMTTCSLVILIRIIYINIKTKKHNFEVRYPVVLSHNYYVSNNHMIACCTKWYIHSCADCLFTK